MTKAILPHDTSAACFRSSQNTKRLFSRTKNSWCDSKNHDNFPKFTAGSFTEKNWIRQYYFGTMALKAHSALLEYHCAFLK